MAKQKFRNPKELYFFRLETKHSVCRVSEKIRRRPAGNALGVHSRSDFLRRHLLVIFQYIYGLGGCRLTVSFAIDLHHRT